MRLLIACAPLLLAACSPALDWREVRPEGSALQGLLPCRPTVQQRAVPLAGAPVPLLLSACSAGDHTWALASADVGDPARVGPALDELRRAAAANVGSGQGQPIALAVPGATPLPQAGRVALQGKRPDGSALQSQVAVFARGTRVYQATVIGPTLPPADALDTFFGALKAGS